MKVTDVRTYQPESPYSKTIRESIDRQGLGMGLDPRHIEALIRLEHTTLDALSPETWDTEVRLCAAAVRAVPYSASEALAKSFGL